MSGETVTETWVYAGRRLNGKGQVRHAWWSPTDSETPSDLCMFAKVPAHAIGHDYEVDVERSGEGRLTVYGSVRWQGETSQVDEETVRSWRTEDAAARHDLEAAREEKRAMKDDEVEAALNVLRRHFENCRSYSAKWSFAQYVAAEVARPPSDE